MNDGLDTGVRDRIRGVLRRCPKIERGVLFGSRAMGTYRPASDIDLALEGASIGLADLLPLLAKIDDLNLPIDVELVIRHRVRNPAVEEQIRRHGVEWYPQESPTKGDPQAGAEMINPAGETSLS